MKELIPVTLFSLICAVISHLKSGYDPINGTYAKKEHFFYFIMTVALILFAGLRTGYNDTHTYLRGYAAVQQGKDLSEEIDWSAIGENPGFTYVLRLLNSVNVSSQTFLMIFAIFTVGTNLWFFRKYSCNMWFSVLLFITFAGYIFNLAAIKQCTAMAFCLIATDRAIRKKYLWFAVYLLIATTFHPYALMYVIVPFLFFRPWSQYTVFMLIFFGLLGVGMQYLVGTLLSVTAMLGESYDAASFTGEGVHPVRLLVTMVPIFLSLMMRTRIAKTDERSQFVITNLTMLNGEIMFVALFGTANYFARLANYFIPFQAVSIPWLLHLYDDGDRRTLTVIASVCYLLFFIYSQAIHESFDANYYSITLWEYITFLFTGG